MGRGTPRLSLPWLVGGGATSSPRVTSLVVRRHTHAHTHPTHTQTHTHSSQDGRGQRGRVRGLQPPGEGLRDVHPGIADPGSSECRTSGRAHLGVCEQVCVCVCTLVGVCMCVSPQEGGKGPHLVGGGADPDLVPITGEGKQGCPLSPAAPPGQRRGSRSAWAPEVWPSPSKGPTF